MPVFQAHKVSVPLSPPEKKYTLRVDGERVDDRVLPTGVEDEHAFQAIPLLDATCGSCTGCIQRIATSRLLYHCRYNRVKRRVWDELEAVTFHSAVILGVIAY